MNRYEDVPGWLPVENVALLEQLIVDHDVRSVIEVGAWVGKSTVFFAERVEQVYSVEPFDAIDRGGYLTERAKMLPKTQLECYMDNVADFDNIQVIQATSEEGAKGDFAADLIYLDGSHDYQDVRHDIAAWLPKTRKVLCGDDYSEWWPGVRQAVDESGLPVNTEHRLWFMVRNDLG